MCHTFITTVCYKEPDLNLSSHSEGPSPQGWMWGRNSQGRQARFSCSQLALRCLLDVCSMNDYTSALERARSHWVSVVIIHSFFACDRITESTGVVPLCLSGIQVQLLPKKCSDCKTEYLKHFSEGRTFSSTFFSPNEQQWLAHRLQSRADGQGTNLLWYYVATPNATGFMVLSHQCWNYLYARPDEGRKPVARVHADFLPFRFSVHVLLLLLEHLNFH